jgi:hemolysin D
MNKQTSHSSDSKPRPEAGFNQFTTSAMALQALPPSRVARMITGAICLMALITVVFSYFAQMDIVVTTQGRVIPTGKSKVIQPLDSGIVRVIAVRDGQRVKAGDILIELDPTTTSADRNRLQREYWEADADVRRQTALLSSASQIIFSGDTPQDIVANQQLLLMSRITEQRAKLATVDADVQRKQAEKESTAMNITQLRTSLPLIKKKNEMREDLAKSGHITEAGVLDSRLEVLNMEKEIALQSNRLKESEAGITSGMQQRNQVVAEFRAKTSGELTEAMKRRDVANQELVKANQRRDLQVMRSPINGVVQQLAISTNGGVVTPAQQLMTIVPADTPLEIDAQVLNRDIGFIKIGQRVINKVETFDFTRFGYIEGEVQWVGTDAIVDPKLGPIYPIRIKLNSIKTPNVVNGREGIVTAGMTVASDVHTDQRRMIEYFLAPLLRYKQEALRER